MQKYANKNKKGIEVKDKFEYIFKYAKLEKI
jgi:hypothetical protein